MKNGDKLLTYNSDPKMILPLLISHLTPTSMKLDCQVFAYAKTKSGKAHRCWRVNSMFGVSRNDCSGNVYYCNIYVLGDNHDE